MNGHIKLAKAHAARVRQRNLIFICLTFVLLACRQQHAAETETIITPTNDEYPIRVDIRFGYKYFSLQARENGKAFVRKGRGAYFTDDLGPTSLSDSIIIFKLDSIAPFLKNLEKLRTKPLVNLHVNTDAPRVEVYYRDQKILDHTQGSAAFLNLYRPILSELPSGFNPYYADENPFGL